MAKRLRSMASILWDSDVQEVDPDFFGTPHADQQKCMQLEREIEKLREEVNRLKKDNEMLRVPKPVPSAPRAPLTLQCAELISLWPKQKWLASVGVDVATCVRLTEEVLPQLEKTNNANHRITFALCESPKATASAVLNHVEKCICDLSRKYPAVFKVGITSNPVKRWCHSQYGYALDHRESWLGMKILAACSTSFSAALIESALIRRFQGTPGCRNDKPGGETPSPEGGPHFTYVVYKILLPPARVVSHAMPKDS